MSTQSATRIGEWFWGAQHVLEDLRSEGVDIHHYVPLVTAAQYLSISKREIYEKCQEGTLLCASFGVLGTWIPRGSVPKLAK